MNLGFGLKAEERRRGVFVLRLQRLSERSIAELMGVSQPTVSRDLRWWRENGAKELPHRDPAIVIGESVALFDYLVSLALGEHDSLLVGPHAFSPRLTSLRMRCLRLAIRVEKAKIRLLRDVGLLTRYPFERPCVFPTANEIRARLAAAGVFTDEGAPRSAADRAA